MTGFYASVMDGVRTGLLLGPYDTHDEAMAVVDTAAELAETVDPRAHFYSFGTAKVTADRLPKGRLNHLIGRTAA